MIIGYDCFGDDDSFDTCNHLTGISLLELKNMMIDELHMDSSPKDVLECNDDLGWQNDTILSAKFQGNTECGSIGANGFEIDSIAIKKRRYGDMKWDTVDKVDYSSSDEGYTVYEGEDKYVSAYEKYEYAITPIAGGVEGNYNVKDITVEFDWAYIFDAENYYTLMYDFSFGDFSKKMPSSTIQPLDGKYPIVVYSGNIDYSEGSVRCKILADDDGEFNTAKTKVLKTNIVNFLTNRKPKVIKGADGTYMLVNIVGDISLTSNGNVKNIYDVSFSFSEIGDMYDKETVNEYGLIGVDGIVSVG